MTTAVILDSTTITTDPFAGLSSGGVTYTTSTLSWVNVSSDAAVFRVVGESTAIGFSQESESITVSTGGTGTYTFTTLSPVSTYKFTLERYEIDSWIQQTSSTSGLDYVESTTYTSTLSVATGSSSSSVTFSNPGITGGSYTLKHYSEGGSVVSSSVSQDTYAAFINNLEQGVTYTVELYVTENDVEYLLDTSTLTTSAAAAMVLTGPFSSYVVLDWSASVDGQGSNYRIVDRTESGDVTLVSSSSASEATIQDLTPGSKYVFVLQREELNASWSDQSEITTTALTTALSISSVASKTVEVTWSNLYDGAEFELFYNGTANGKTTDLSSILRDLTPSTAYELELVVYELGVAVGLSSLGMTTNDSFLASNSITISIIIAIIALIVGMLVLR